MHSGRLVSSIRSPRSPALLATQPWRRSGIGCCDGWHGGPGLCIFPSCMGLPTHRQCGPKRWQPRSQHPWPPHHAAVSTIWPIHSSANDFGWIDLASPPSRASQQTRPLLCFARFLPSRVAQSTYTRARFSRGSPFSTAEHRSRWHPAASTPACMHLDRPWEPRSYDIPPTASSSTQFR